MTAEGAEHTPRRDRRMIWSLCIAGAVYFWFCMMIMFWTPLGAVGQTLGRFMIVPVAVVDGHPIWYPRVAERARALAVSTDVSSRVALQSALNAEVRLTRAATLSACDAAIPTVQIDDDPDFREVTGWSQRKMERFLTIPMTAAAKAKACTGSSSSLDRERGELEDLRAEIERGMPFADAAKIFSEDRSAAAGGGLGTFTAGDAPTWLQPAFALEGDAISDVLRAPEGLWIIRVVARGGEGDAAWIQVRGILKRAPTLEERVTADLIESPPWIFLL